MQELDRENLKNKAVETREQGDYEEAIAGFEQVIEWDEENKNYRGEIDTLGHLQIAYTNWSHGVEDDSVRQELIQKSEEALYKALSLIDQYFPDDKGLKATFNAHLADLLIDKLKIDRKNPELQKKALEAAEASLSDLAGSEAHKAWVLNKLAQIHYLSGNLEGASRAISDGEWAIMVGYKNEMKETDGLLKIRVWQSGLWLTKAIMCKEEGKTELARLYLESVINLYNPTGTLNTREEQAWELLESL